MISTNGKSTLERLSAADKFQWRGEQLVTWRFIVCVVVPLMLSIGRIWLVWSKFYFNMLFLYCAVASIAWVLFEAKIASDRRLAARILQLAECDLYGIRWNKYLCGEEPLPEDVFLNMRLNVENYKNYYLELQSENEGFVKNVQNIIVRFKMQREHHLKLCKWMTGISIALIVLSASLVHNVNFNGFVFYAVLPCVPIVIWFQAVAVSYKRSAVQLGMISNLDALEVNERNKDMIQDCVFIYRDNAYIVPRLICAKG